jgi:tetratricopeptide (TPR) repeat protein
VVGQARKTLVVDYSKHLQKADEALKKRNWDFAIEVYQSLLDMEPDLGEARAGLRVALRRRHEQKGGGMKLFKAIAGAGPLAVAKGLAKAGKHAAAAKSLEQFLASNPLDEDANLELGRALENAGFTKSALAVYEFLAEIAPRNPEGLKRAGAMAYRAGEHAKRSNTMNVRCRRPRDQDAPARGTSRRRLSAGRFEQVSHSREQIRTRTGRRAERRGVAS